MNKKKPASKIKTDAKNVCGMLKAHGSVTDELLRERRRDTKHEATKYGRRRRG
jgi:hypothetical protein